MLSTLPNDCLFKIRNFLLVLSLTILVGNAQARIYNVETTRLKSTGGAGSGALLMNEATLLNPASISFFNVSSMYIQKSSIDTTGELPVGEADQLSFIASDAKGNVDGSISYNKRKIGQEEKEQWAGSASSSIGKKSAMGFGVRVIKETYLDQSASKVEAKSRQVFAGITHALNESFTFGVVLNDPMKKVQRDTYAKVGLQYVYKDFLSLMVDGAADYNEGLSETSRLNAAMQLKLMSDFYLRYGAFENKALKRKGSGAGLSWVGPKLVAEISISRETFLEFPDIAQSDGEVKETTFAMSYRF